MIRWEYRFVVVVSQHGSQIRRLMVDGVVQEYPQGEGPTLYEAFAELGRDAWELVGFEGTHTYILKRPIQDTGA